MGLPMLPTPMKNNVGFAAPDGSSYTYDGDWVQGGFVDPEHLVEGADWRDRCLSHPNRADLFTFDQGDFAALGKIGRESRRRHPPGRAAADDQDLADGLRL